MQTTTSRKPLRFSRLGGGRYQAKLNELTFYVQNVHGGWYLTIDNYDYDGNGRELVEYGDAIFRLKAGAVQAANDWVAENTR